MILTLVPIIAVVVDYFIINKSFDVGAPTAWVSVCLSVILTCWWVFVVREVWVRDAATAYAIRLLAACESDGRT